jgi:hypothetical protein
MDDKVIATGEGRNLSKIVGVYVNISNIILTMTT